MHLINMNVLVDMESITSNHKLIFLLLQAFTGVAELVLG